MIIKTIIGGLFWIGVGVLFCSGGLMYGLGGFGLPGPGFFPFVAGLILVGLALTVIGDAIVKHGKVAGEESERFFPQNDSWKRVVQVLFALCLYIFGVERLGFFLTTFIFMLLMLRLEPRKWRVTLPAAFLSTLFFYALFEALLKVPLPRGILWF